VRPLLALGLIVAANLAAESMRAPQRFTSRADHVLIDALVTQDRRVVSGLTPGDFELFDNGVAQTILQVYVQQLPLSVIMVLDTSGSVQGERLDFLKKAAAAVVERLRPDDRAAIVSFSAPLTLQAPLTGDRAALLDAINALKAEGSTALIDAAFTGLALRGVAATRALVLLFSDGVDTASMLSEDRVLQAARRSDATVYAIGIRDTSRIVQSGGRLVWPDDTALTDDRFLSRIAAETGGRLLQAQENRELATTFARVIDEFNSRYVLGYEPTGVPTRGWHDVSVRLKTRRGTVLARRGYFSQ
jgi:VWFA-related protein